MFYSKNDLEKMNMRNVVARIVDNKCTRQKVSVKFPTLQGSPKFQKSFAQREMKTAIVLSILLVVIVSPRVYGWGYDEVLRSIRSASSILSANDKNITGSSQNSSSAHSDSPSTSG